MDDGQSLPRVGSIQAFMDVQRINNKVHKDPEELQAMVTTLQNQIKTNKIFLYMVIHDLKHPTDSMISQLSHLQTELMKNCSALRGLHDDDTSLVNVEQSKIIQPN